MCGALAGKEGNCTGWEGWPEEGEQYVSIMDTAARYSLPVHTHTGQSMPLFHSRFKDNHGTSTCHKLTCKRHLLCLFNKCLCAHVCMTLLISSKFLKFKPEHSHNHPDFEEAVCCRTSLSPCLPLGSTIVTLLFVGTKLEASLTVTEFPSISLSFNPGEMSKRNFFLSSMTYIYKLFLVAVWVFWIHFL